EPDRYRCDHASAAQHRPQGGHRLLHGQRPGVVRHHRLRLLRSGDQPAVLPGGGRRHRPAAHLWRVRHVVRHPAAGRAGPRLLLRPVGPQERAHHDHRDHDAGHRDHGVRADGGLDRLGGRSADPGVTAAAGLLRRRRVRHRHHLPGGERPRAQGLLRLLAGRDPGPGHADGLGVRLRPQRPAQPRAAGRLGLADPLLLRAADRAGRALHPAEDGRDAGVRGGREGQVAGHPHHRRPHRAGAQRRRLRRPGVHLGLPDPLHAHVRGQQPGLAALRRLPRRHHQRPGQLHRRPVRRQARRPDRPAADHAARGPGRPGAVAAAVPGPGEQPVGPGADPGPGGARRPDGVLLRTAAGAAVLHVPDEHPDHRAVDLLQHGRHPVRRVRADRADLADQLQRQPAVPELLLHDRRGDLHRRPAGDPPPPLRRPRV
ncbi:MAG: Citrate-proton symporter, partial [uncultured Friedmanniella sp.]